MNPVIQLAVDKTTKITGIRTVLMTAPYVSGNTNITIKNNLRVSDLKCKLLSTPKSTANIRSVLITKLYAKIIYSNGSTLVQVVHHGHLFLSALASKS